MSYVGDHKIPCAYEKRVLQSYHELHVQSDPPHPFQDERRIFTNPVSFLPKQPTTFQGGWAWGQLWGSGKKVEIFARLIHGVAKGWTWLSDWMEPKLKKPSESQLTLVSSATRNIQVEKSIYWALLRTQHNTGCKGEGLWIEGEMKEWGGIRLVWKNQR